MRVVDNCTDLLNKFQETRDLKDYLLMYKALPTTTFEYKGIELNAQQYNKCRSKKLQLDSLHREMNKVLNQDLKFHKIPINTLKYNLDYSMVGTQSCNGCIPVKGLKTLYLGFENEKMTSSVYLWLEAISAVKTSEYFKEKYIVETVKY